MAHRTILYLVAFGGLFRFFFCLLDGCPVCVILCIRCLGLHAKHGIQPRTRYCTWL